MFGKHLLEPNNTGADYLREWSLKMINYWSNFVHYDIPSTNNEWAKFKNHNGLTSKRNVFSLKENNVTINSAYTTNEKICSFWNNFSSAKKKSNTFGGLVDNVISNLFNLIKN